MKKWTKGRQKSGYRKLTIFQFNWIDLHIIDYPKGSSIPIHRDPIEGKQHWRLNLKLLGEDNFVGSGIKIGPLRVFRSDFPHEVKPVSRRRIMISLGLAI
jgi:hypothetical protein